MNRFLLTCSFAFVGVVISHKHPVLKLWNHNSSANLWKYALSVGYKRFGEMVYGNAYKNIVYLKETPLRNDTSNCNDNEACLNALSALRLLIFGVDQMESTKLVYLAIINKKLQKRMFTSAGELGPVFTRLYDYSHYYRVLATEKAIAAIRIKVTWFSYSCNFPAFFADQINVMNLFATLPGSISFKAFNIAPQQNILC